MQKRVWLFKEGNADMRNLLGGKGANLAEMTNLGLPIPQGFTVTTEACTNYYDNGKKISEEIEKQIEYINLLDINVCDTPRHIFFSQTASMPLPRAEGPPDPHAFHCA